MNNAGTAPSIKSQCVHSCRRSSHATNGQGSVEGNGTPVRGCVVGLSSNARTATMATSTVPLLLPDRSGFHQTFHRLLRHQRQLRKGRRLESEELPERVASVEPVKTH